jgi:hypothetical protein
VRGLAESGVACGRCGRPNADTTGLCLYCRARCAGLARRKYYFTGELLTELRAAYAGNKPAITKALNRLEHKTGWPRWAFTVEARRRGWITADHRRTWTPEEVEYLCNHVGVLSARRIAKLLRRSVESVTSKAERLELSRKVREGYTFADLQSVFGEHYSKVRRWYDRGLLGRGRRNGAEVRIAERDLARFIREHSSEYDLRRVDQEWFKSMVFAPLAGLGGRL